MALLHTCSLFALRPYSEVCVPLLTLLALALYSCYHFQQRARGEDPGHMGCKSSKLFATSVELSDKPRSRSRANLKLDFIQYLPNEPLELPAPHHDDVIPDNNKKTAGGGTPAAAAAAAAAACSPRSPTLTPAMTPHAEEEQDPAVPASTIIVQQCSVASEE
ncbi:unnamed protein product, partial [Laminaria digitata]